MHELAGLGVQTRVLRHTLRHITYMHPLIAAVTARIRIASTAVHIEGAHVLTEHALQHVWHTQTIYISVRNPCRCLLHTALPSLAMCLGSFHQTQYNPVGEKILTIPLVPIGSPLDREAHNPFFRPHLDSRLHSCAASRQGPEDHTSLHKSMQHHSDRK